MKKSNDIIGLPLVSITEGVKAGKVQGTIIDPQSKEVAALLVEDEEWYKGAKIVPFNAIRSIGEDAIIIDRIEQITTASANNEIEELINRGISIIDSQIITTSGKNIGKASEFFVDPETGKILTVEITGEEEQTTTVDVDRVLTFGKDAMIISEEGEAAFQPSVETVETVEPEPSVIEEVPPEPEEIPYTETPTVEEVKEQEPEPTIPSAEEAPDVEEAPTPEAEQVTEEEPEEETATKTLEERQHDFLIGKTMRKDVVADDGTVIIKEGETVSEEAIQKAKEFNKYLELTFSIKRS